MKGLEPITFFQDLNKDTIHLVDAFYDEDVVFVDPMVRLNGRESLRVYYKNLYDQVQSVSWNFLAEIKDKNQTVLPWTMTLKAENLNKKHPIVVDGVSVLTFGGKQGKVVYHRDYFDMGAFVYEGLPVLGGMVRFVKGKMAAHQKGAIRV